LQGSRSRSLPSTQAGAAVDFAGVIGHDGGWLRETLGDYGVGLSLIEEDDKVRA